MNGIVFNGIMVEEFQIAPHHSSTVRCRHLVHSLAAGRRSLAIAFPLSGTACTRVMCPNKTIMEPTSLIMSTSHPLGQITPVHVPDSLNRDREGGATSIVRSLN